jgi:hypothetical protein
VNRYLERINVGKTDPTFVLLGFELGFNPVDM